MPAERRTSAAATVYGFIGPAALLLTMSDQGRRQWWLQTGHTDRSPSVHALKPRLSNGHWGRPTRAAVRLDVAELASFLIAGVACRTRWRRRREDGGWKRRGGWVGCGLCCEHPAHIKQ